MVAGHEKWININSSIKFIDQTPAAIKADTMNLIINGTIKNPLVIKEQKDCSIDFNFAGVRDITEDSL